MRIRTVDLVAAAAIPALLLAGCGDDGDDDKSSKETSSVEDSEAGDDQGGAEEDGEDPFAGQSPAEVIDAAAAETRKLEAFRLQLDDQGAMLQIDLWMSTDGRCTGTLTDGPKQEEIRSDGTDVYVKGNRAFWEANSSEGREMGRKIHELVGDKWVKLSKPEDITASQALCDPSNVMPSFDIPGEAFTEEGEVTTLDDGTEAVEFSSSTAGTVAISVEEPHVVLHNEVPGKSTTTLSDVGEEPEVEKPAPGEVMEQPTP